MAHTYRDDPAMRSGHRADEIGVHERRGASWLPWLIGLLVALVIVGLIWAFARRDRPGAAITPPADVKEAVPDVGRPDLPRADMPEAPEPAPPGAPGVLPPAAREMEGEGMEEPGAREPVAGADEPEGAREQAAGEEAVESGKCGTTTFSFATDQKQLQANDRAKLDELASCLKANPSERVQLVGRAHPQAGAPADQPNPLALNRARMIEQELRQRGVAPEQLNATSAAPFCTENDEACLTRNRSVTVTPAR